MIADAFLIWGQDKEEHNRQSQSLNSTTMESEVEPYLGLRHSKMVDHRWWFWKGIVQRNYQWHQGSHRDLSLCQSSSLSIINDLSDKYKLNVKSQVRLFADDTAVNVTITKLADSEQLQADLESSKYGKSDEIYYSNPANARSYT